MVFIFKFRLSPKVSSTYQYVYQRYEYKQVSDCTYHDAVS